MMVFRLRTQATRSTARALRATAAFALLIAASGPAAPEAAAKHPSPEAATEHAPVAPEPILERIAVPADAGTEIERFCSNIADAARDRRYALQAKELQALQQEIDRRIELLEAKRAEYETWMKRRDEFVSRAEDGVVKIYGGMRPDAAAERLAELDATLAAAILMKLDARKAGVILNEMERKAAAVLTGIMASAARKSDPS